jgi:hypothetical protein
MRLIALTVLAGIIVPASSALAASPGSIGIRLVKGSVDSRNDPRAGSYIIHRLAPGAGVRRRVEITNNTRSTADVAVYPAAAALRRGNFAFAAGHGRNELSSWTSVSRGVLHMAPGTKAFETVTIDVPADASSGKQYAVIWAEVSTPAPPAGGVTLINRVGIRMYVTIGPGGAEPSNFVIGALTAERSETGEPRVVAVVRNTGGRRLALTGDLTLARAQAGFAAGRFRSRWALPLPAATRIRWPYGSTGTFLAARGRLAFASGADPSSGWPWRPSASRWSRKNRP